MSNQSKKEYSLNFQGYWREVNKGGIPSKSGIYLVYRCLYNSEQNTVGLKEIIYIGQAEDAHERIATHDKLDEFKTKLQQGEELCYSFAEVDEENLEKDLYLKEILYRIHLHGGNIHEYQRTN